MKLARGRCQTCNRPARPSPGVGDARAPDARHRNRPVEPLGRAPGTAEQAHVKTRCSPTGRNRCVKDATPTATFQPADGEHPSRSTQAPKPGARSDPAGTARLAWCPSGGSRPARCVGNRFRKGPGRRPGAEALPSSPPRADLMWVMWEGRPWRFKPCTSSHTHTMDEIQGASSEQSGGNASWRSGSALPDPINAHPRPDSAGCVAGGRSGERQGG